MNPVIRSKLFSVTAIKYALLTTWFLALSLSPAQASSIYIKDGPDAGETQVLTAWGDYVAYDEGGGSFWVGTQKEYGRNRVVAISQGHNARLSTIKLNPDSTAEFVEENTYRTHIGKDIALDEIIPEVAFNDPVEGYTTKTHHTLSVTWIQSSHQFVKCLAYDPKHHYLYPSSSEDVNQEWHNVVFGMENAAFTRPLILIFLAKDRKPAIVPISSIAQSDYVYEKARIAEQDTEQDENQLHNLLKFIPSLVHEKK
jgi:hypothetical protein